MLINESCKNAADKFVSFLLRIFNFRFSISQLRQKNVSLLLAKEAEISGLLFVSFDKATQMDTMTTAAKKIVEKIVFKNVLFNEVGQPDIRN